MRCLCPSSRRWEGSISSAMCLAWLTVCEPRASEILVVDQSGEPALAALVSQFTAAGARIIPCPGRGAS